MKVAKIAAAPMLRSTGIRLPISAHVKPDHEDRNHHRDFALDVAGIDETHNEREEHDVDRDRNDPDPGVHDSPPAGRPPRFNVRGNREDRCFFRLGRWRSRDALLQAVLPSSPHSYRLDLIFLLFGGPSHEVAKRQSLVDRRSISGLRSSFSSPASFGSSNRTVARFTNRSSNVFCRLMSALLSSGSKVTSMSRALFMPAGVIMPVFE